MLTLSTGLRGWKLILSSWLAVGQGVVGREVMMLMVGCSKALGTDSADEPMQ